MSRIRRRSKGDVGLMDGLYDETYMTVEKPVAEPNEEVVRQLYPAAWLSDVPLVAHSQQTECVLGTY
jgi:hypothetical protein